MEIDRQTKSQVLGFTPCHRYHSARPYIPRKLPNNSQTKQQSPGALTTQLKSDSATKAGFPANAMHATNL